MDHPSSSFFRMEDRHSKTRPFPGLEDPTFLTWLEEFFFRIGTAENLLDLADLVMTSLPDAFPLSYLALLIHDHPSRITLKRESEAYLKSAALSEIPYDPLVQIPTWPCSLERVLVSALPGEAVRALKEAEGIRCVPIRVGRQLEGLLCFKSRSGSPDEVALRLLDLVGIQIGLNLGRLEREKKIKAALSSQIDEMAELEKMILRSERQSCMAEMALGVADGIRNPITVIGGLIKRISKKISTTPSIQRDWAVLLQELERLDRLIKDFEKFGRKREFIFELQDVRGIIQQTADIIEDDFLNGRKVRLALSLGEKPLLIKMDRKLLGAVLTHLLLNAVEASGKEGEVAIVAEERKGRVVVEIIDHGGGIPPKNLDRIFDPFFTSKPQGTGLGLTYARQIVTEHQGEIGVKSGPGKGTTFTLSFPMDGGGIAP
jgi:signal transduction histidine kinase